MKYLADTDFLINLYRAETNALEKLQEIASPNNELFTTTINAAELFEGSYKSKNVTKSLSRTKLLLSKFQIHSFSYNHSIIFGELMARLKGIQIGAMDTLIAAIAITEGNIIVTQNIKHFQRTGVEYETW